LEGAWQREFQDIAAASLFVPIAQPCARLVMHLLEPQAPDSFAAWGFFNACFEQKEYMEPYVADQIARTLLAQTPALPHACTRPRLEAARTRRLKAHAGCAANPRARLEFFLRRHSSWDSRMILYPVFRVDELLASPGATRE